MVSVRVPATSANVGCGFDSLGVALTLYTTFKFEKLDSGLEFVGFEERFSNENNLVYQTLLTTLKKLNKDTQYLEDKIDEIVYDLYELTEEERELIRNFK